jgi:acetate CoA/acetoacetate CoA-transferase alpha subunit
MSKTIRVANAVEAIPQGSTLMIGGFMGVGSTLKLIDELVRPEAAISAPISGAAHT